MKTNLIQRLINFSISVMNIAEKLGYDLEIKSLRSQVCRSATSVGANYQESQSASSKADFINKLQIALKELMETIYWLNIIEKKYGNLGTISEDIIPLIKESEELRKILSSCILTARQNLEKEKIIK